MQADTSVAHQVDIRIRDVVMQAAAQHRHLRVLAQQLTAIISNRPAAVLSEDHL